MRGYTVAWILVGRGASARLLRLHASDLRADAWFAVMGSARGPPGGARGCQVMFFHVARDCHLDSILATGLSGILHGDVGRIWLASNAHALLAYLNLREVIQRIPRTSLVCLVVDVPREWANPAGCDGLWTTLGPIDRTRIVDAWRLDNTGISGGTR